jgi:hypothetical protein
MENLSIYLFLSKNLILNLGNIILQTFYIKISYDSAKHLAIFKSTQKK